MEQSELREKRREMGAVVGAVALVGEGGQARGRVPRHESTEKADVVENGYRRGGILGCSRRGIFAC